MSVSGVSGLSPHPLTQEGTPISDHIAKPFLSMPDMAGSFGIMTGSLVCGENEIPIEWPGFPGIFVHPPFLLRSKVSKHLSTSSVYHGPSPAFSTNFSFKVLEGLT